MSPVFRHGRLRLYLLKLLDEAPRHGYEVIRLLQDRFMGVYAPSPGTIYPRLARLEEDGLVTHEEVDGKKIYSITDKGREEIRARLGDLADLEDELTESLRDVAREISVDVRDTVRSIREELASAAREFRIQEGGKGERAKSGKPGAGDEAGEPGPASSDEAQRIREDARRSREQMRAEFRAQGRGRSDWAGWTAWSDWASGKDWTGSKDWAGGRDWTGSGDWTGGRDRSGRKDRPGHRDEAGARDSAGPDAGKPDREEGTENSGREDDSESRGQRSRRGGPNPFSDLERIAIQFATELRAAARQTGDLGERSLNDLRDILTDTLAKVRVEVFSDTASGGKADSGGKAGSPSEPDDLGQDARTETSAATDPTPDRAHAADDTAQGRAGEAQ